LEKIFVKKFLSFWHTCKIGTNDVILNKEELDYVWVTIDEVLKLPIELYTSIIILKYKENFYIKRI